jgi:hypothetical protein
VVGATLDDNHIDTSQHQLCGQHHPGRPAPTTSDDVGVLQATI